MPASPPPPASSNKAPIFRFPFGRAEDGAGTQIPRQISSQDDSRVGFQTRPGLDRSSVSFGPGDGSEGRRTSVQFKTAHTEETLRRASVAKMATGAPPPLPRRMSSPPPPSTYNRGVSFDTFENRDATDFSLTLNFKHRSYEHTRRSRTFLCGTDQKDYSEFALQWLLDELVDDGDEIVCLRVVEKDSKVVTDSQVEEGKYRVEAQSLLDSVIAKNKDDEKAISLIVELAVGKVQDIIQRTIQIYEPAVLIVGTRGRNLGGMQGLLPGSVSKYCLQQSPIPVIVVRPSSKRAKKKKKRMNDPNRRGYNQILEMSAEQGGYHLLDKGSRFETVGEVPEATEQEAEAVAKALGLPQKGDDGAPLTKVISARSDATSGQESPSPTGPLSPEPKTVVMKSPVLGNLESPQLSDDEDADERSRDMFESQPGKSVGAVVDDEPTRTPLGPVSNEEGAPPNEGNDSIY